jgi:hypothetical protein
LPRRKTYTTSWDINRQFADLIETRAGPGKRIRVDIVREDIHVPALIASQGVTLQQAAE